MPDDDITWDDATHGLAVAIADIGNSLGPIDDYAAGRMKFYTDHFFSPADAASLVAGEIRLLQISMEAALRKRLKEMG